MIARHIGIVPALALPLLLGALPAAAEEAVPDAHALFAQNCTKCHGTEVFTRPDRKITSYDGLDRQVRRCESALGLGWSDEQITAMTAYLNRDFYRFMPDQ